MTTGVGSTLTMGCDGLRRLTSISGGPVARQFTYRDIDSTKTTLQVASVTSGGQKYSYTYDSIGNIATYVAPGKGTVTYPYDNQGQLLKAAGDTTYTYTYDGAGNILTASNGTTSHTYTYGNTDWKDLLTAFDGSSITYDAIGNPTSYYNGTRWTMSWVNGRNLASATAGNNTLSFAYDASGLRTSKTVNGTTYRYYYAGSKLLRMTWGTNTIDFFYDAQGTPYALKYNGTAYYYVTNLQGDVMRIVNASGTVMASYDYDPYGKVISATGTLANVNPLRYRGYVYDTETGFYYLQSRYYDPAIRRFINADSYATTGQGIIGYNMFAYCGNNPIIYSDSTGHHSILSLCLLFPVANLLLKTWLFGDGSYQTYDEESVIARALQESETMRNKVYDEIVKFESGAEYGTGSIRFQSNEPDLWIGIRRASYQMTISKKTSHYKIGFFEDDVVSYEVNVKLYDTYNFNTGKEKGDGVGSLLNNFGYWVQEHNIGAVYGWEVNFTYEVPLFVQI